MHGVPPGAEIQRRIGRGAQVNRPSPARAHVCRSSTDTAGAMRQSAGQAGERVVSHGSSSGHTCPSLLSDNYISAYSAGAGAAARVVTRATGLDKAVVAGFIVLHDRVATTAGDGATISGWSVLHLGLTTDVSSKPADFCCADDDASKLAAASSGLHSIAHLVQRASETAAISSGVLPATRPATDIQTS